MSSKGRRHKPNVQRDANGKSRGETSADIKSVVLAQRARVVGPSDADNALAGFALGRLYLRHQRRGEGDPGSIDKAQYEAGERFAWICRRYSAYKVEGPRPVKAMGMYRTSPGKDCRPDPDEEVVQRLTRQHDECWLALREAGTAIHAGINMALIVKDVCLENRSLATLGPSDIGLLREGLNVLVRVLR